MAQSLPGGREHLQGIRVDLPDLRGYATQMGGIH